MFAKNLLTIEDAVEKRFFIKKSGETLVLTNGCFDLLHAGHVHSLYQASKFGSHLWVALNSDKSVQKIKGKSRPIVQEDERAYMLLALKFIRHVFLFESATLEKEIELLKPDFYVKSSDYNINTIDQNEKSALMRAGSKICFVDILKGKSTTNLIKKIKSI